MNDQTGKLLVAESDDALRAILITVLVPAGYKVSKDYHEGMKAVLTFEPDLVILGADPTQLDCCDLLSEIKGSKQTRKIRVVMLVHGSSAERTGGLDLGADDALPLDPAELLSRIRSQLRSKQIADERSEGLRLTEETRESDEKSLWRQYKQREVDSSDGGSLLLIYADVRTGWIFLELVQSRRQDLDRTASLDNTGRDYNTAPRRRSPLRPGLVAAYRRIHMDEYDGAKGIELIPWYKT